MRLKSFFLKNDPPIQHFSVEGLSDVIVIAGPNGVGKTRVTQSLVNFFRSPQPNQSIAAVVEATSDEERTAWRKTQLNTQDPTDAQILRATLQRAKRRHQYSSSVLQFESDRSVRNIQPYTFSFDITDPLEEQVGWDIGYAFLRDRFQEVRHTLFRLVDSSERKIAQLALRLKAEGRREMSLDFPDPLARFKEAFVRLLAPKKLLRADLRQQTFMYEYEGKELSIEALSSGEREVVNIVFDFIIRNPTDSIIVFDEPELHLHPELSYKLLQSLTAIGRNNQFIYCTHSPEIITASLENSVVFLAPPKGDGSNQALMVSREDETHHALNLLGQSIGIISLGKKLVLIEGDESSLDKQTYGAILKSEFPDFVLVPVGGKHTIRSFDDIRRSVLNRTIWGVEFFLLCDRDAVYQLGKESVAHNLSDRLKVLPRYHLENYFLDEQTLALCFAEMEVEGSWLLDPARINHALRAIARETVPHAVALNVSATIRERVGNIDIMPKGVHRAADVDALLDLLQREGSAEVARISRSLDITSLQADARQEYKRLINSIEQNHSDWRSDIPGRPILKRFASQANIDVGRLKRIYLRVAERAGNNPFAEVIEIFRQFGTQPVGPRGAKPS